MHMNDSSRSHGTASKTEMLIALIAVSAIIGFSYQVACHAVLHTLPDPSFRSLVRPESHQPLFKTEFLYVPLLFQCVIWLSLCTSLLPVSFQERWLLKSYRPNRLQLCFMVVFCLLVFAGIYANASDALLKAAVGSNVR